MARKIDDPGTDPGTGGPGDPGYTPPTSGVDTKIAVVTTNSAYTFNADEIIEAGGPWETFTIKVTPVNDSGSGTPAEIDYTTDVDVIYDGGSL